MSATRGLATVALLKVNFDAGRDHIGMFEPFVVDAVASLAQNDFTAEDVAEALGARHQLVVPLNTLRTLLTRVIRSGSIRREAGRYFRTEQTSAVQDLVSARTRIEERQRRLATVLRETAAVNGLTVGSDEDALAMILEFLERYHVSLALEGGSLQPAVSDPGEGETRGKRETVTAVFLRDTVNRGGDLADVVQETLEGFILQNTLLLRDISSASRRFRDLHVYCDSGLLFGALGFRGVAVETATRELLSLLRDTGADLNVFETTIREMERILYVYEQNVGSVEGRLTLHPTDLTRYFLTEHYSPSDIREQSGLLAFRLGGLGINIRELPTHQAAFTFDEADLSARLADKRAGRGDARVAHDTECVAGVLTLRAGRDADSLDDARCVFVSTSGWTVRSVEDWYRSEGGAGVPPMVHYLVISNLAWLKRPSSGSRLKLHELIALCVAALRPSREAWQTFLRYLKKLEGSSQLSSDELTAVVASRFTDEILGDAEVDEESDASTLSDVVDRIKATYEQGAAARLARATERAELSEAEASRITTRVDQRVRSLARVATWLAAILLAASFIAGTILSIASAVSGFPPTVFALVLAIAPLAVFGLMSLLFGFQLAAARADAENRIARWLHSWIAG